MLKPANLKTKKGLNAKTLSIGLNMNFKYNKLMWLHAAVIDWLTRTA